MLVPGCSGAVVCTNGVMDVGTLNLAHPDHDSVLKNRWLSSQAIRHPQNVTVTCPWPLRNLQIDRISLNADMRFAVRWTLVSVRCVKVPHHSVGHRHMTQEELLGRFRCATNCQFVGITLNGVTLHANSKVQFDWWIGVLMSASAAEVGKCCWSRQVLLKSACVADVGKCCWCRHVLLMSASVDVGKCCWCRHVLLMSASAAEVGMCCWCRQVLLMSACVANVGKCWCRQVLLMSACVADVGKCCWSRHVLLMSASVDVGKYCWCRQVLLKSASTVDVGKCCWSRQVLLMAASAAEVGICCWCRQVLLVMIMMLI